ncbi:hypothetical protein C8R44DRAFT_882477 [Mycena epipterygia]|nr:hypothetical protein C8R44DRAFT_882477 [Mycena epipterygia]
MAFPSFFALPVALALLFTHPVHGALTNLTIDDANSTFFTYSPAWAAISPDSPCDYCSAQPLTAQIHDQTWHDGSNGTSGSFTFQGAEVFLYGIDLANPANISFVMDDVQSFHYYSGSEQFVFNSLFFHAGNLTADANHTVSWTIHETKKNGTTALFDYAVITVEEPAAIGVSSSSTASPTSHASKSHAGVIAGALIGAIGGAALLAAGLLLFLRRRQKTRGAQSYGEEEKPRAMRVRENYVVVQPFAGAPPSAGEPSLVDGTSPTMPSPSMAKRSDAGWHNADLSQSTSTLPYDLEASDGRTAVTESSSQMETSTMTSSVRERFLEDRLAILEAHVNQHLPPPYERASEEY